MREDPYDPGDPVYECHDCGHRLTGESDRCPDCEGAVRNIAVPRE